MKHFLRNLFRYGFLFIAEILLANLTAYADGSKDFYPSGATGRRAYLQSRHTSKDAGTFNPFPNRGTHRVWVQAGETIYVGSSLQGRTVSNGIQSNIVLRTPNGNSYNSGTSTTVGYIANRTEELAGPDRSGVTIGYTPFTRVVGAAEAGIWEIDFVSMESDDTNGGDNGTNLNQRGNGLYDNDFQANFNWVGTGTNGQPLAEESSALILAWDVSVGSVSNAASLLAGRVYFTNITLTLPNNYPPNGGFFGKTYLLTKEGYSYQIENNNLNGASWSLFSNNKGIVAGGTSNVGGFTGGTPTYLSEDEVAISGSSNPHTHDPRIVDGANDFTNKQFYAKPAADLPASASIRYYNTFSGGTTGATTTTWLKNSPFAISLTNFTLTDVTTGLSDRVGPNGANLSFNTNIGGLFTIDIDANDDGDYIDALDRRIERQATVGTNTIFWDGKNGNGIMVTGTVKLKIEQNFLGEVHFPMVDVEINPLGIIVRRLNATYDPISGQDLLFWNDENISNLTGASNVPSSPFKNNINGLSSTSNGHKFGAELASTPFEGCNSCSVEDNDGDGKEDFGNAKIINSWTRVNDLQELTLTVNALSGAALGITKTTNLPNAVPGSSGTYTITVNGGGTGIANDVTLDDVLPVGVIYTPQSTLATIQNITKTTNTVRDEFTSPAYNLNAGTVNWSTNWTETGETGGTTSPTAHVITVNNQGLRISGTTGNVSINRGVNLSGVTSAVVSFNQNTTALEAGETIEFQMSNDGGLNYTTIASFQGSSSLHSYTVTSPYFVANARLRFIKNSWIGNNNDASTIDNIQVEFSTETTTSRTLNNNGTGAQLVNGLPPTLISSSDNIDLTPSSIITLTFNYTVNCSAPNTFVNTAAANSPDLLAPVSASVTSNFSDTSAPTITCPSNTVLTSVPGSCAVIFDPAEPTTTDNCSVTSLTWVMTGATSSSGSNSIGLTSFNPGTTTITYTATDSFGNTAICSFTVFVNPCVTTVTGHLYVDTNGDGKQDSGEPDLANMDVIVTDANGIIQRITTDAGGNWTATVPPGSTTANVDETDPQYPAGSRQTEGTDPTTVTAVAGTSTNGGIDGYFVPALPVDLIDFTAKKSEEGVKLSWKTANERNFSHFEIQRSANGKEFGPLASVNGSLSNIYNYSDTNPSQGINYYRLKMVDLDGTSKISKIIRVGFEKGSEFVLVENPATNGEFNVNTNWKNAKFTLMSILGKPVKIHISDLGNGALRFKVAGSASGIYLLNVENNELFETKRVIIP